MVNERDKDVIKHILKYCGEVEEIVSGEISSAGKVLSAFLRRLEPRVLQPADLPFR
jgi:hypothetical protein